MRPTDPSRVRALAALAAVSALAVSLAGAGGPKKKHVEPDPPKVEEAVGDLAYIQSHAETKLEGVGLVVGLENTGVDPPPSYYRQKLLDEMKKAGVENANAWLKDPRVSMVIVRMTIPAGVSTTDRLDVEVELPPASGTTSLAGGRLLECRLREVMILGGAPKEGPEAATVQGPVMTGSARRARRPQGRPRPRRRPGPEGNPLPAHPQRQPQERPRRQDGRDGRQPAVPADPGGRPEGLGGRQDRPVPRAEGPPGLPPQPGPLLPGRQAPADGRQPRAPRRSGWPPGRRSCSTRRRPGSPRCGSKGWASPRPRRSRRAWPAPTPRSGSSPPRPWPTWTTPSGADELAEAAVDQPEFRAYALAALAAIDQPAAHMKLRKLMDEPDVEVRYGAFDALRTLAEDDPFLGQVRVLDEPEGARRRGGRPTRWPWPSPGASTAEPPAEDPFALYLVDCDGPPMVHVARTRRCEIVVFGRGQKLLTPVVLGTGAAPAQRRRRRRHAPDQQDRPEPVQRQRRQGPVVARTRRRHPPDRERSGRATRRSSRSSRPPRGRRTSPARSSSTPCPATARSTSRPTSSARTRPPRRTTP